jgi:hypothetical protein
MGKLPGQSHFAKSWCHPSPVAWLLWSDEGPALAPIRFPTFCPNCFVVAKWLASSLPFSLMITAADLSGFLRSNPGINRLNFAITMPSGRQFLVYPQGFATIGQEFAVGNIAIVHTSLPPGLCAAFATSAFSGPELRVSPSISLGSIVDQMTLVHECTHALFNYQGIAGSIVNYEDEKICHFIEVVFLAALRVPCPATGLSRAYAGPETRALAERIAWGGLYRFNYADYPVLARFSRAFGYN